MLAQVGYGSLDELTAAAVPDVIKSAEALNLPSARTEAEVLAELRSLADRNTVLAPMIGLGYYGTFTPPVILRNVMENPAWYTAYTPYQPEISQGRLEALLNFQTMVAELTGLPTSGASLLDEGTAAAEAMALARRVGKVKKGVFLVDADTLPQTVAVIETRAEPTGVEVVVADLSDGIPAEIAERGVFGVLLQYPGASGAVRAIEPVIEQAHELGAIVTVAADLLAPHPPHLARRARRRHRGRHHPALRRADGLRRPARLHGRPREVRPLPARPPRRRLRRRRRRQGVPPGAPDPRAAHPPREGHQQHLHRAGAPRRHGRDVRGLPRARRAADDRPAHPPLRRDPRRRPAHQPHAEIVHDAFFDTLTVRVPGKAAGIVADARERGVNLRLVDADHVSVACDETTTRAQISAVWAAFGAEGDIEALDAAVADALPEALLRTDEFLAHPVFHQHRSETAMLRYLRKLADRDYALDRGMIPLGSCTMKLNATAEMESITWPEFGALHPFAPPSRHRASSPSSVSWRSAWRRSPATTRCPSSPTPRRASSRGCWPSARTTGPTATTSAPSA